MNCELCRDWLLNADDPASVEAAPQPVAEHFRQCDACQDLMCDLVNLEKRWRDQPLPAQAEVSKQAFLVRLSNPPAPAPAKPSRRRWLSYAPWAMASMLFIGVGATVLFFGPSQEVQARPDVLDQLIDWNLDLSDAGSPADRKRIYEDRHETLKKTLNESALNPQERELGESLLDNGTWMAENENPDPIEELNRFNQVADRLLDCVNYVEKDAHRSSRFARQFRKIHERAITKNFERIKLDKIADPERRKKFNKLLREDADRADKILLMADKAPDTTKKELRHALDLSKKRHKKKHISEEE